MYSTMAKISNKKLQEETLVQIHKRLVKTLKKAGTSGNMGDVLDDLLTETEEIMIAKRLSIIFLLNEGMSMYAIHKHLGVSKNTVSYMKERFLQDGYDSLVTLFKKKKEREEMWSYLEIIIRGGMPERGKNRWKALDRK